MPPHPSSTGTAEAGPPRPLVVTDAPDLLDDLLRLAAAADIEVDVAHTAVQAVRAWNRAPLVVVGADMAATVAAHEPARHPNLVLTSGDTTPPEAPDSDPADTGSGGIWRTAVELGAWTVLTLPHDEERLIELFADAIEGGSREATAVGIVGGRGGAGASLLSVAVARAGVRAGARTVLIDADPLGGGLDLVLGQEHAAGARWHDLVDRQGRIGGSVLWDALPTACGVKLLTWGRDDTEYVPAAAMRAVLTAARRGADLVVADLPRAVDAATAEILRRAATVVLLVPADVRAVVAAARLTTELRSRTENLRVAVRSVSPGRLPAETVARSLGLPLAGEIPSDPRLDRALERGEPPDMGPRSPLGAFGDTLLASARDTTGAAP